MYVYLQIYIKIFYLRLVSCAKVYEDLGSSQASHTWTQKNCVIKPYDKSFSVVKNSMDLANKFQGGILKLIKGLLKNKKPPM